MWADMVLYGFSQGSTRTSRLWGLAVHDSRD